MKFLSEANESTQALGTLLASFLHDGQVVALYGNLGAGKTVLSRGVARGLGIDEAVTSPTFTVAQEYQASSGRRFNHLDMYRIDDERSALAFGIEEYLFDPGAVTLVEWPERIAKLLRGGECLVFTLSYGTDQEGATRIIELPDDLGQRLLEHGLPAGIFLLGEA